MSDRPNQPRFLILAQVADELNVKQSLVQGLISTGELRGFQVGARGLWRIGRQDVEDYIDQAYSAPLIGSPPASSRMARKRAIRNS